MRPKKKDEPVNAFQIPPISEESDKAAEIFQGELSISTFLNSLSEGVVFINNKGKMIHVNQRTCELFDYKPDELIGKEIGMLLPERYRERHALHIAQFFESPKTRSMGKGTALNGRKSSGEEFYIENSLTYLQTETEILGIALITDITIRKKAESMLQEKNAELEAYNYTLAHDIKSTISGITGLSELLASSLESTDKSTLQESLTEIAKSSRKISRVVDEILLLSQLSGPEVVKSPANMNQLIENACERLSFQIQQSGAEITAEKISIQPNTRGPWIEEVLYNLILNAIKYSGTPPKIQIFAEKKELFLRVHVKDNGQGMSEDLRADILRGEESVVRMRPKGTGLGLRIISRILKKLEGDLDIQNEPTGVSFIFSLPI